MAEYKAKVTTCERCGNTIIRKHLGTEHDWDEIRDKYEELPKEWMFNSQIGYTCPECSRKFQLFVLEFMDYEEKKIAPAWKNALLMGDL